MRRFQQLLQGLDRTTGTSAKQQLLTDYFRQAPAADAAWGLELLLGNARQSAEILVEVVAKDGQVRKGPKTPQSIFELIDPTATQPSPEKIGDVVDWLYGRILLRVPTQTERQRLVAFTQKSIGQDGRLLGVRNMVAAVLLGTCARSTTKRKRYSAAGRVCDGTQAGGLAAAEVCCGDGMLRRWDGPAGRTCGGTGGALPMRTRRVAG